MIKRLLPILIFFALLHSQHIRAQQIPLYIGTYTQKNESKGIYTFAFDTKTGDATLLSETETASPSFLARHKNILLAANELTDGNQSVSAFRIENGKLQFLNKLPTTGSAPCHVIIDTKGKYAVVSNYLGGALDLYAIDKNGQIRQDDHKKYSGSSVDTKRQEAPHIHSAFQGPDGKIYVSDLGTDLIHVLTVKLEDGKYQFNGVETIQTPKGAGPRHIAFHPNKKYFYALMEMSADVVVYEKTGNSWKQKQVINMNAEGFSGKDGAADVKVSKDGKFVYASNRVDANTISTFAVQKDGSLNKIQVQSVLGKGPRNFNFSPDQNFLLVGNQLSNEVVIFKRDKKTGLLNDSGKRIKAFKPVCLIF